MITVVTSSVAETAALGEQVGRLASAGDFIALTGELGTGKTHFAKGVAAGLGVDPAVPVTSPTYTLMNVYDGRLILRHFDLYRLDGDHDATELGFGDYFHGDGVCVVEWAERLQSLLPDEHLTVAFTALEDDIRCIAIIPTGRRYEEMAAALTGR